MCAFRAVPELSVLHEYDDKISARVYELEDCYHFVGVLHPYVEAVSALGS